MNTEQEILQLNDAYHSFWYCYRNKNANIKLHEKIIIDSKNPYYCYMFARYIKNSNKELISKAILLSQDLYYIKAFYDNINFNKSKYQTLMLFL
jgi:hypothetical protein